MEKFLCDLIHKYAIVTYIDDIKITLNTWQEYVPVLLQVLQCFHNNGFTIHPHKCKWVVLETNFLGFWFTPNGVKPWNKKIQTILLALAPPTNCTKIYALCGAITFYWDIFLCHAYILAPITQLQSKDIPFVCSTKCQWALDTIKNLIAQDILLAYPDPNVPFKIYTNASDLQLGAIIKQHGEPVAFYSCKLTPTQQHYSTIEKEFLSTVETLHKFQTFFLEPLSLCALIITILCTMSNMPMSPSFAGASTWKISIPPLLICLATPIPLLMVYCALLGGAENEQKLQKFCCPFFDFSIHDAYIFHPPEPEWDPIIPYSIEFALIAEH